MEKQVKIIVEIDEKGEMTMKAEGFTGGACLKEIEALMKGMNLGGATITHTDGGGEDEGQSRNLQPVRPV